VAGSPASWDDFITRIGLGYKRPWLRLPLARVCNLWAQVLLGWLWQPDARRSRRSLSCRPPSRWTPSLPTCTRHWATAYEKQLTVGCPGDVVPLPDATSLTTDTTTARRTSTGCIQGGSRSRPTGPHLGAIDIIGTAARQSSPTTGWNTGQPAQTCGTRFGDLVPRPVTHGLLATGTRPDYRPANTSSRLSVVDNTGTMDRTTRSPLDP